MGEPFTVSVIVPIFGDEKYATWARERAVPSVQSQPNGKRSLVLELITPAGANVADARNNGAADAHFEWLCFLDADDELEPGYFQAMARGTADLRGPACVFVRPGGRRDGPMLVPARPLEDSNYLVIGTLIRREMFHAAGGFDPQWKAHEDYDLWLRCERRCAASIEQIEEAVYVVYERPAGRNRSVPHAERLAINRQIQAAR